MARTLTRKIKLYCTPPEGELIEKLRARLGLRSANETLRLAVANLAQENGLVPAQEAK